MSNITDLNKMSSIVFDVQELDSNKAALQVWCHTCKAACS